jgi:quinoprotein glucose dehydrogenase
MKYGFTGYHRWFDPDGYPRWHRRGELNAINLNTGSTPEIPLGEYPDSPPRD